MPSLPLPSSFLSSDFFLGREGKFLEGSRVYIPPPPPNKACLRADEEFSLLKSVDKADARSNQDCGNEEAPGAERAPKVLQPASVSTATPTSHVKASKALWALEESMPRVSTLSVQNKWGSRMALDIHLSSIRRDTQVCHGAHLKTALMWSSLMCFNNVFSFLFGLWSC